MKEGVKKIHKKIYSISEKINFFILWVKKNKKYTLVPPEIGINLGCEYKTNKYFRGIDGSFLIFLLKNRLIPKRVKKYIFAKTCTSDKFTFEKYINKIKEIDIIHHNLFYGIPFKSNSISFIFSSNFLEHIDKEGGKRLLKECYRVLKPKGKIRIIVPDLDDEVEKMKNKIDEYVISRNVEILQKYLTIPSSNFSLLATHKRMYNFEELRNILQKEGFKKIKKSKPHEDNFSHTKDLDPSFGLIVQAEK
jgi:predicted SAM-dependent methyltransferase